MKKKIYLILGGVLVLFGFFYINSRINSRKFNEEDVVIRLAIYPFGFLEESYLIEITDSGNIRSSVGVRHHFIVEDGREIDVDLENFFERVLRERTRRLRTADFNLVMKLVHELEKSEYSGKMQLSRGGWGIRIYYNGIVYERGSHHISNENFPSENDEIFRILTEEIIRLSPLRISVRSFS